jgi:DNA-binding transcriptional LysR family regulator
MLDVRRMRVLREVASRGSIAAAAQSLSFTPSAVSQQIATLERETGVALVERGPRSVRLTEAGRALVSHTESLLAQLQAAEADIQAIAGVRRGTLRVSSFPTAYATILPPTIREFRRRHPGVELTLTETDPLSGLSALKAGALDVALIYEYDFVPLAEDDAVELIHLLDDPINALLPSSHPAARKASVRLNDLAEDSWVTSTPKSACHSFVRRACNAAGFEPDVSMESDDHGVWLGLVAAGVGVALASELSIPSPGARVAVRPIRPKALRRRIYAAHRVGAARSPAVSAILDVLLDETARRRKPRPALVAG